MAKSTKPTLADLREKLSDTVHAITKAGGASTPEIIAKFKSTNKTLLADLESKLIDLALTKLIDGARRRRLRFDDDTQAELFSSYGKLPESIVVGDGISKQTPQVTGVELIAFLSAPQVRERRQIYPALAKIADAIKKNGIDGSLSLSEALRRIDGRKRN
ncbi:hypothetical protein [Dongia sedimenti]|uniref:DUF3486 family protein n=1 Tax=Dongia sedimenti TaxID=3064282 RepID=A0ABU0YX88_9PROT|nr:hypothetical protein [Rhodospirillaceae bacterium R-7]